MLFLGWRQRSVRGASTQGRKWGGPSCVLPLAHLAQRALAATAQEVFPTPACVVPQSEARRGGGQQGGCRGPLL